MDFCEAAAAVMAVEYRQVWLGHEVGVESDQEEHLWDRQSVHEVNLKGGVREESLGMRIPLPERANRYTVEVEVLRMLEAEAEAVGVDVEMDEVEVEVAAAAEREGVWHESGREWTMGPKSRQERDERLHVRGYHDPGPWRQGLYHACFERLGARS